MAAKRARDYGLPFSGTPGPFNAITDVPGVEVGYATLINDDPVSPARTGVTAILPRGKKTEPQPVWAGMYALNGNGEMTGTHWIHDGGYFTGPVMITNSHGVGITHHAATRWMINHYRDHCCHAAASTSARLNLVANPGSASAIARLTLSFPCGPAIHCSRSSSYDRR